MDLREHPSPGRCGLVQQGEVFAPDVGHAAAAEHAERDRPSAFHRELAQPHVIVAQARIVRRSVHTFTGELHDPGVEAAQHR